MTSALLVVAGIAAVLWTIGLLDWLARRRDRKSRHRHAS
jgi:hypothetical protein